MKPLLYLGPIFRGCDFEFALCVVFLHEIFHNGTRVPTQVLSVAVVYDNFIGGIPDYEVSVRVIDESRNLCAGVKFDVLRQLLFSCL